MQSSISNVNEGSCFPSIVPDIMVSDCRARPKAANTGAPHRDTLTRRCKNGCATGEIDLFSCTCMAMGVSGKSNVHGSNHRS